MKALKGYAILAAAVAVALLAAGCSTTPGGTNATTNASVRSGPEALLGTWQLTSFLGANGQTVQAVAGSIPLVIFTRDNAVTGTVGCNRFSANYTASGNQISFGPVVSTLMYCSSPAGVMDQEQRVFALFPLAAGYVVAGSTLTLLDKSGGTIMTMNRVAEPADAPLVGTVWRLAGFSDNVTARSALAGTSATMVFSPDGTLSGNTGCNDFSGPYTTKDATISTGPLQVTARACTDTALQAQERDLLQALRIAATYDIQGNQLVLADRSGSQQVSFVRAG